MKTSPPRGMNDMMPDDMSLRDAVQGAIIATYRDYGYQRISTPILEDAENLQKSEGGDNLNLIYQVMKRGDKLQEALKDGDQLWDLGLRYDLTLPLARYFANNHAKLPTPFKVIQTDRVYRAERPQRGRLREFVQCDIDIIGDAGLRAEAELIAVTAQALLNVGFSGFAVRINDRRVLNALFVALGFGDAQIPVALVAFDKLDKVGMEGVCAELVEKAMPPAAIEQLSAFMKNDDLLEALLAMNLDLPEAFALRSLIDELRIVGGSNWTIEFDLSLVRGQGYYTGAVFEIVSSDFEGSIAGGGRYDTMIEKFTGISTPAVGFSIGFERIITMLKERGFKPPAQKPALALLYADENTFPHVFAQIQVLVQDYLVTALPLNTGNPGRQRARLAREGFGYVKLMEGDVRSLNE